MSQILYGILLLAGIILAYFAFRQFQKTQYLLKNGVFTEATVIDLLAVSGKSTTYKPVFEYFDISNHRQTFTSEISSRPPDYKVGEQTQIVYDPNNASNIKVIGFWGLYRWAIILMAIASPLLVIGGGYIFYLYTQGAYRAY